MQRLPTLPHTPLGAVVGAKREDQNHLVGRLAERGGSRTGISSTEGPEIGLHNNPGEDVYKTWGVTSNPNC